MHLSPSPDCRVITIFSLPLKCPALRCSPRSLRPRKAFPSAARTCAQRELSMSLLANIWNHPKTSVSGLLLAIITVGGVLAQNGVSLGKAGTGTVVSLISATATALLGLLSRDPADSS